MTKIARDRFLASEEVSFDRKALRKGVLARKRGCSTASNPYPSRTWAHQSWNAGWADQDMVEREGA